MRAVPRARSVLVLGACALGSLGASRAWALDPTVPITGYVRPTWTVRDGLPQAHVRALAQTPDGYLWVGTDAGVARFDGVRFSLPAGDLERGPWRGLSVRTLLGDREGTLWIGSNNLDGLLRLRDGRVRSFSGHTGMASNPIISAFQERTGALWFGGWHGVTRASTSGSDALARPQALEAIDDGVFAIAQGPDGALWFGRLHGLSRLLGEDLQHFGTAEGLPDAPVRALAFDRRGRLWIGTEDGLFVWTGGRLERRGRDDGLPDDRVKALLVDRDGALWIGTEGGLARMVEERFEAFVPAQGLLDGFVSALFEDREGSLWVGTIAGLQRLGESRLTTLPLPSTAGVGTVRAVQPSREGGFWIGTSAGILFHHRGSSFRSFGAADGVCVRDIWSLHEDRAGRLWIAGFGRAGGANLCVLEEGRFRWFGVDAGLAPASHLRSVHEDRRGRLWVGGHRLYRQNGDRFDELPLPGKRPKAPIHEIREDAAGRLWLATAPLFSVEPDGSVRKHESAVPFVRAVLPDGEGRLWTGSAAGLDLYLPGKTRAFGEAEGLPEDMIARIVDDGRGQLWLCTRRGVVRVEKADLLAVADGKRGRAPFTRYGAEDGYEGDQCDPGEGDAGGGLHEGRVFFASARGVAFVESARQHHGPAPGVFVERVLADGRLAEDAALGPGRGDLEIAYTATWLRAPERVFFRYRLEPFDSRWVDAGTRRVAYYTNVPPGTYRFVVEARSDEDGFAPRQTGRAITLAPHFHQTRTFQVLLAAALVAVGLGLHRLRLRQVEARHRLLLRERNRIAREIHDTLAQAFTGIALHLEATRTRVKEPPEALEGLRQARSLVEVGLEEARRAVWDLRAESLEKGGIVHGLGELVRRLEAQTPVKFRVHGRAREVPSRHASALLRVGQEAITNALRHASASRIDVEVSYEPRAVELVVRDDGTGIPEAHVDEADGHFGLAGMRERVEELGGTLVVGPAPQGGTVVRARVPLPNDT